jgi:hypothetical protein
MAKEEKIVKSTKFEWRMPDDDGTVHIWYWDTSKNVSGPIRVEVQYSKEALTEFKEGRKEKRNKKKQKA